MLPIRLCTRNCKFWVNSIRSPCVFRKSGHVFCTVQRFVSRCIAFYFHRTWLVRKIQGPQKNFRTPCGQTWMVWQVWWRPRRAFSNIGSTWAFWRNDFYSYILDSSDRICLVVCLRWLWTEERFKLLGNPLSGYSSPFSNLSTLCTMPSGCHRGTRIFRTSNFPSFTMVSRWLFDIGCCCAA